MADLSLTLPIFVASPSDVMAERQAADEQILNFVREAAKRRLLLQPFSWEKDYYPVSGEPQPGLTEHLRRAELVVVILAGYIGPGTEKELEVGLKQAKLGQSDNVAIYFKHCADRGQKVKDLQADLIGNNRALTWDFSSTDEFRQVFVRHLREWLNRWNGVPACCQFALEHCPTTKSADHLGQNRLTRLERIFDLDSLEPIREYLSREAMTRYQRHGPVEVFRNPQPISGSVLDDLDRTWRTTAISHADFRQAEAEATLHRLAFVSPKPLLRDDAGQPWYADGEWFCYFCARGLADAIAQGDVHAVARHPYVNPIHQYLSACAERDGLVLAPTLASWLTNKNRVTSGLPVARNFAAYVLGMLGAREHQDELAATLREDSGQDVKKYCITSLGKLRSRRYLPLLVELFQNEMDPAQRMLISQAVCNIVGIAPYDL